MIVVLVLILAGIVVWLSLSPHQTPRVSATSFTGQITALAQDTVSLNGSYDLVSLDSPVNPNDLKQVKVNLAKAQIIKKTVHLPTSAELLAMGGNFDPTQLKTDTQTVDAVQLKDDFQNRLVQKLTATAKDNVINADAFNASEIQYIVQIVTQ
jgi:hypothetical protein